MIATGSASMITDYKGDEYQRIEYTPYGETWVEKTRNQGLEYLPYKFTGKEKDEETGLYYYGARYLDPKYSAWISTDPALGEYIPSAGKGTAKDCGNLPGMGGVYNHINGNLYHYAGNNPVKYVDPDGRQEEDKIDWVKEITDVFSEVKFGLVDKASISIPNVFQAEVEIDFVSNDWVNNKGDESDSGMTSGVSLNVQLGKDECPIISGSLSYAKKSPQMGNAFSLLDEDYEFSTEMEVNSDFKVTPPIPFVNVTLNLTEAADLLDKLGNYIYKKIEEGRK